MRSGVRKGILLIAEKATRGASWAFQEIRTDMNVRATRLV